MSFRNNSTSETRMRDWMRNVEDRLHALENGGGIAGEISLARKIHIGGTLDIEIIVADTGGGHRTVTFRNPANGLTSVITL